MAPEHQRLLRYPTMTLEEIAEMPVAQAAAANSHLYLWVPNALLAEGLEVMNRWGYAYKSNIAWFKTRKDGGPDGRGVGFYFRNVIGSCQKDRPRRSTDAPFGSAARISFQTSETRVTAVWGQGAPPFLRRSPAPLRRAAISSASAP